MSAPCPKLTGSGIPVFSSNISRFCAGITPISDLTYATSVGENGGRTGCGVAAEDAAWAGAVAAGVCPADGAGTAAGREATVFDMAFSIGNRVKRRC